MSDYEAKMHQIQIRFPLGLVPRPRWRSLQRSPRRPSWDLLLRGGRGKGEGEEGKRRGGEERGEGKEGDGKGWEGCSPIWESGSASAEHWLLLKLPCSILEKVVYYSAFTCRIRSYIFHLCCCIRCKRTLLGISSYDGLNDCFASVNRA